MRVTDLPVGVARFVLVVTVMGAFGCGSNADDTKPASSTDTTKVAATASPSTHATSIGVGTAPICAFSMGSGKCIGYSELDFTVPTNAKALADFIDGIKNSQWNKAKERNKRKTNDPSQFGEVDIRVIEDSKHVQLKDLARGGVVMARLDVRSMPAEEARYGITKEHVKTYGKQFYIVVDLVQDNPSVPTNGGLPLGRWRIYGVTKATPHRLEQVGTKEGINRYCLDAHTPQQQLDGARFQTCPGASYLAGIERIKVISRALKDRESLLSAIERVNTEVDKERKPLHQFTSQDVKLALEAIVGPGATSELESALTGDDIEKIRKILEDFPTDPAWMTCGIGCCTADGT